MSLFRTRKGSKSTASKYLADQKIELDDIDTHHFDESADVPEYGSVGQDDYYMSMTLDPKKIARKVPEEDEKKAHNERNKSDKFAKPFQKFEFSLLRLAHNPTLYGTFDIDENRGLETKEPTTAEAEKLKRKILARIESLSECMRDCSRKTYGSVGFFESMLPMSAIKSIERAVTKTQKEFSKLEKLVSDKSVFNHDQIKEIRTKLDLMFSHECFKERFKETHYKVDQTVKTQAEKIADSLLAMKESFAQLENAVRKVF